MSVSTYVDVWCDVCGRWETQATEKTGRAARVNAKDLGWRVGLPGGIDVCPLCVHEGKTPTHVLGRGEGE